MDVPDTTRTLSQKVSTWGDRDAAARTAPKQARAQPAPEFDQYRPRPPPPKPPPLAATAAAEAATAAAAILAGLGLVDVERAAAVIDAVEALAVRASAVVI
jgi:hypothetical protein